jgi:hypothetical protein
MNNRILSIAILTGVFSVIAGGLSIFPIQAKSVGYDRECHPSSKWKKVKSYQFVTENRPYSIVQSFERVDSIPHLTGLSLCLVKGDLVKVLKVSINDSPESNLTESGYERGLLKKIDNTIFEIHIYREGGDGSSASTRYSIDLKNPKKIKVKVLSNAYG